MRFHDSSASDSEEDLKKTFWYSFRMMWRRRFIKSSPIKEIFWLPILNDRFSRKSEVEGVYRNSKSLLVSSNAIYGDKFHSSGADARTKKKQQSVKQVLPTQGGSKL